MKKKTRGLQQSFLLMKVGFKRQELLKKNRFVVVYGVELLNIVPLIKDRE